MKQDERTHLYQRIYRLKKRNFRDVEISAALHLPLTTVKKALQQLGLAKSAIRGNGIEKNKDQKPQKAHVVVSDRNQYILLMMGGDLITQHLSAVRDEMNSVAEADDTRPVAMNMRDVRRADSPGIGLVANFHKKMEQKNRSTYILDPSQNIELLLNQLGMTKLMPIFGTETALGAELREHLAASKSKRTILPGF